MMMKTRHIFDQFSSKTRYEGYLADVMARIAWGQGWDFDIRLVPDNTYGEPTQNGSWNGAIGKVISGVSTS